MHVFTTGFQHSSPDIDYLHYMNRRHLTLLLAILAFAMPAAAQQWIDKNYTYQTETDVVYGTAVNFVGETDSLRMDIYLPDCDDEEGVSRRPLLLWIHGGGFTAGSKNDGSIVNLCKEFAKRGYVTASINYRLGYVSDDAAWSCNFPLYACMFAADSAEWYRGYFRGVQDAKGALRYLSNRHEEYRIDTANVFIAGESAGAMIALGVGLMDSEEEKLAEAYALSDLAAPHPNSSNCPHNEGIDFESSIARPDLGSIHGDIETGGVAYQVKGIGNMYGAMFNDLLLNHDESQPKPAIYSFHQPCDLVVPINSNKIAAGLTWCMTNGYNCAGIANTPTVHGAQAFSAWNTVNSYGYDMHNEFTSVEFPFNYLFGQGSCLDQVSNPCHAYDSPSLRENNLAAFFADQISTFPICDTAVLSVGADFSLDQSLMRVYPNPSPGHTLIEVENFHGKSVEVYDAFGRRVLRSIALDQAITSLDMDGFAAGMYLVVLLAEGHRLKAVRLVKD